MLLLAAPIGLNLLAGLAIILAGMALVMGIRRVVRPLGIKLREGAKPNA